MNTKDHTQKAPKAFRTISEVAGELDLDEVVVVTAENYPGDDGRENSALPLNPSIVFA